MAAAVALCAVCVLAACSGQPSASSGAASGASAASAASAAPAASGSVDVSSWKTLGDAYATATEAPSYSYDDKYWVSMFHAGDAVVRVVANLDEKAAEGLYELNFEDEDYIQKLAEKVGGMELVHAEDVTANQLTQATLDGYVGKTGQDLIDEGFAFESYFLYGGAQTGGSFSKDYFSYEFTFDGTTAESATEDGGESVLGYKIVEAMTNGNFANAGLDPAMV